MRQLGERHLSRGRLLWPIWLGLLLGVSFIATPAKFLAPSLDLPIALDVGRHTFRVFAVVESALLTGGVAMIALKMIPRRDLMGLVMVAALMAAQYLWLLPALDLRVAAVIAGQHPPPSWRHPAYLLFEVAKAAILFWMAARRDRASN